MVELSDYLSLNNINIYDFKEDDLKQVSSPSLRVTLLAGSTKFSDRQRTFKILPELFNEFPVEKLLTELPAMMKTVLNLAEDSTLKYDLWSQIPAIATAAQEAALKSNNNELKEIVYQYLVPYYIRHLGCTEMTVPFDFLLQLIKQNFISKLQIEIQVCPTILAISKDESVTDVITRTIWFICQLGPYLGHDAMERVFLNRFIELCSSQMLCVRKSCATNFVKFAAYVRKETFLKSLFPSFLKLCEDPTYDVRQSCAETIMLISLMCDLSVRRTVLAPIFIKLLEDENKWVKLSAYHTLGPFIATFAEPPITKLSTEEDRCILTSCEGTEFLIPNSSIDFSRMCDLESDSSSKFSMSDGLEIKDDAFLSNFFEDDDSVYYMKDDESTQKSNDTDDSESSCSTVEENCTEIQPEISENDVNVNAETTPTSSTNIEITNRDDNVIEDCINGIKDDNLNNNNGCMEREQQRQVIVNIESVNEDDLYLYNSYNYWYISPELPLDPNIVNGGEMTDNELWNINSTSKLENSNVEIKSDNKEDIVKCEEQADLENKNETATENDDSSDESSEKIPKQDIVPQQLIDNYTLMAKDMNLHKEMPYYCAYSMPAVVLTIGQSNWPLLKNTVELLASHLHYKVRHTVASSLHELANVLGPDIATDDLTPLFDDFLKDLDIVKIGILKHLGDFLKLIRKSKRNSYLPRLTEFLKICNDTNWRYVEEFLKQLLYIMELNIFKPILIARHVRDYCRFFLADNIAALRDASLQLTTEFIKYISNKDTMTSTFLVSLAEQFAHSKNWKHRQTFALLCCQLVSPSKKALTVEQFTNEMLPHLLDLSWDPVANVRLVVARTISQNYFKNDYFQGENVEMVLRRLQADKDRDVRQSAQFLRYSDD